MSVENPDEKCDSLTSNSRGEWEVRLRGRRAVYRSPFIENSSPCPNVAGPLGCVIPIIQKVSVVVNIQLQSRLMLGWVLSPR